MRQVEGSTAVMTLLLREPRTRCRPGSAVPMTSPAGRQPYTLQRQQQQRTASSFHRRSIPSTIDTPTTVCIMAVINPPPIGERSIVISVCVCVCVCVCLPVRLSAIISSQLHVRSSPNVCACYLWPWLGLLWRSSDTLCTSGFMDDVIFVQGCSTSPPS